MQFGQWISTAAFAGLVMTAALYGLAAAGHFPREHRAAPLRSGAGAAILWGTMAVAVLAAVAGIVLAARVLPWTVAVIAGGGMLLAAPLVLQGFSDRFVDGRGALVVFSAAAVVLAGCLLRLT